MLQALQYECACKTCMFVLYFLQNAGHAECFWLGKTYKLTHFLIVSFQVLHRTNALQLLAVVLALSSTSFAHAQRNEGAAISKAGNNWDNFRIFGRGKIVAINPDVERQQQQLGQRQQQERYSDHHSEF